MSAAGGSWQAGEVSSADGKANLRDARSGW